MQHLTSFSILLCYLKGYALCSRPLFVLWDCYLGALVPRLILLESFISAFRKTILTLQERPSMLHFNISCFFLVRCHLGRSAPSFCHFGIPFLQPGITLGDHFGTSGAPWVRHFGVSEAPWEAILAPRDHPGGPWEQQDGHEVANNRMTESTPRVIGVAVGKR